MVDDRFDGVKKYSINYGPWTFLETAKENGILFSVLSITGQNLPKGLERWFSQ